MFSTFWGDFLTKLHTKPGEKEKNIHWRKFKKSSGDGDPKLQILFLVVAKRVLKVKNTLTTHTPLIKRAEGRVGCPKSFF